MPLRRIPDDSLSAWSRALPDPPAISLLGNQPRSSSSLAHMAHRRPLRPHPWSRRCKAESGGCMGARRSRGHHRRLLGDLFLERKRLEIRMLGENISDRVGDIERNSHSGSRVKFEQTYSRPRPVFTLRSHPRRRLSFSAFAHCGFCAPLLPPAGPAPLI